MQFAIWPSNDRSWQETLDLSRWAHEHHLGGVWYADHFLEFGPDDSRPIGDIYEAWTILTAIGALVPDVRLVSMVSPVTIHDPVVLLKRAITTDHISGGRVVLGLGAGWQVNEHLAYGWELPPPGPRVARFAEAIEVIRRLSRGERVDFHGEHYNLDNVQCAPGPVGSLPLLVGTSGERMMRLTARYADEWNTWGDLDRLRTRTEMFMRACDSVGRDAATMRRSAQAMFYVVRNDSERAKAEESARKGVSLIGSPAELVDTLGSIAALGVDEFGIPDDDTGDTPAQRLEWIDRLRSEVIDQLR